MRHLKLAEWLDEAFEKVMIVRRQDFDPFTRQWSRTRLEWLMAVFIAMAAGYLDGYGLSFLKTYVSFMSGNTTRTGVSSGQGDFVTALPSGLAILCFVSGSFFGNLMSQSKLRHARRLMFGLIAAGIAAVAGMEWAGLQHAPSEIAVMCLAMGMTNPTLSKIGPESVSLTFVTGTLSRIGSHLAAAAAGKTLKDPQGSEDTHLRRALIEGSIWGGLFTGAVLSGVAGSKFPTWALSPPFIVMLVLGLLSDSAKPPTRIGSGAVEGEARPA
jgi:uncharacterized membrane protein YoaK (UPF0700 family)